MLGLEFTYFNFTKLGCNKEVVIADLGTAAGEEALDEVGQFGVEAKAGEALVRMLWLTKLKKLEMSNMRAVDLRPLAQALWMSWVRDRPVSRVEEKDHPLNWVPGMMLCLATSYWTCLAAIFSRTLPGHSISWMGLKDEGLV